MRVLLLGSSLPYTLDRLLDMVEHMQLMIMIFLSAHPQGCGRQHARDTVMLSILPIGHTCMAACVQLHCPCTQGLNVCVACKWQHGNTDNAHSLQPLQLIFTDNAHSLQPLHLNCCEHRFSNAASFNLKG